MENFVQIVAIFGGVLAVVGAAAFIYAYYLVSLNRAQLEALRGDRDDLIKRVELLEVDREDLKASAVKKDALLAAATAKIAVLEGIVTHDASIQELIRSVNKHDDLVEQRYVTYMQALDENMGVVGQVLQAVELLLDEKERRSVKP